MTASDAATLDPPGTVAVVGAGPIGIEAALYGRYLGYDVRLIESDSVAASWRSDADRSLPMSPDDCLTRLAKEALRAQRGADEPMVMPLSVQQWIDDYLVPLTESDLLRGRLRMARVVDVVPEVVEADSAADELPPDFRLRFDDPSDESSPADDLIAEAVIWTPSDRDQVAFPDGPEATYLFVIDHHPEESTTSQLESARRQIVRIFAELGGRAELDLYRPSRM